MPLMGTFTFLSAPEGKVKLEQSPPSCLPVNKSQKVTGEILFLVSDFLTTKLNNNFFIFQKTSFLNQLSKNGNEILRLGTTKFSKNIWETKYGKKIGPLNFFLLDKWKWRGLDHWSTDLQSCKCSWGEIWEIWGTILVQMALIFWQGALHFYIWGVQRTTRFKKSWRQNRNTFTDTFTYKSLDKYSDKYVDKSFYQHLFRNMYLEICI